MQGWVKKYAISTPQVRRYKLLIAPWLHSSLRYYITWQVVYTSTRAGPPTVSHTDSANQEAACAQLLCLYYHVSMLRRLPIYICNTLRLRKHLFDYYCKIVMANGLSLIASRVNDSYNCSCRHIHYSLIVLSHHYTTYHR